MTRFETTRWSVVALARGTTVDARAALDSLCRAYRPPVLAYIRARGYTLDAEDLAQTFFAKFIEETYHATADPARGRFRAFLLTALKRFLIKSDIETNTIKRGGAIRFDALVENTRPGTSVEATMVDDTTPEQVFERGWVIAVLDAAMMRLRAEAAQAGKSAMFDRLSEFLSERPDEAEYERAAAALNMRRNTVAVAVHRLRNRLRDLVRDELKQTTTGREELAAELRELRSELPVLLDRTPSV